MLFMLNPISTQAEHMAQKMGALAYFETSALNHKGLDKVFSYVAEVSVMKPMAKKGLAPRRFWLKH
jgi:hypothetical protein